jgi:hypothetical protein
MGFFAYDLNEARSRLDQQARDRQPAGSQSKPEGVYREIPMKFQSKVIGACVGAFFLFASPAAQASSWSSAATSAANSASHAGNAAAQSAVQSARDDIARRAMAQEQWNHHIRHAPRHYRSR